MQLLSAARQHQQPVHNGHVLMAIYPILLYHEKSNTVAPARAVFLRDRDF
ncbi:hypothetical protein ALC62_04473 [Cyphomyrmex costatus]|uniref:Uncharacterized protein n=1 Tax=Cyphomyrmex costatus TaxID=456900 RepID=A0A151IK52_9HYME|nr:hypothetical protein ALC62_04473 [Cyphomyrmex costatus]